MADEIIEFTSPDEELTDGEVVADFDLLTDAETQPETEAYLLSITDYADIAISSIPIGALFGAIFMIVGLAFLGIVKIFHKV